MTFASSSFSHSASPSSAHSNTWVIMQHRRHANRHPRMDEPRHPLPSLWLEGRDPAIKLGLDLPLLPSVGLTFGQAAQSSGGSSTRPPISTTTSPPQATSNPGASQPPPTSPPTPFPVPQNPPLPDRPDSVTANPIPRPHGPSSPSQPTSPGETPTESSDDDASAGDVPSSDGHDDGDGDTSTSSETPNRVPGRINLSAANDLVDLDGDGVVDLNSDPAGTGEPGSRRVDGRGGARSSSTPVQGSSPTNIDNGGLPSDDDAGMSKGFPRGALIAVAIICAIIFLTGLVVLLRRHRRAKRTARAHHWWFSRKRNSRTYIDDTHVVQIPPPSIRSSFGTSYDRSEQFLVNFADDEMPTVPPMAEIRRSRNELEYPITASSSESGQHQPLSDLTNYYRTSYHVAIDQTSGTGANGEEHSGTAFTSINSPPYHPAPQPLLSASMRTSSVSGLSSRPTTATSVVSRSGVSQEVAYRTPDTSPTPPDHQNLPAMAGNPFADPNVVISAPASDNTHSHSSSSTASFNDMGGAIASPIVPTAVRRPFTGTLHDELSLVPGDVVAILQTFDDGWALVDKIEPDSTLVIQRGLCPIACLH